MLQDHGRSAIVPFIDFGGKGELLHLAHANGFPVGVYRQLASDLTSDHRVIGMNARPLWKDSDPNSIRSWRSLADDLIQFLDEHGHSKVIGVGHSFGAVVTLVAARKRPDLFRKLVLIEPVILARSILMGITPLPTSLKRSMIPASKTALNRTHVWRDQEHAFNQFRNKKVFEQISDEGLWDYIRSGTRPMEDGRVTLTFSKEWEAQIYATIPDVWKELRTLEMPILAIRAQNSKVITESVWTKWRSIASTTEFQEVTEQGHLLPLENPILVASIIRSYLDKEA